MHATLQEVLPPADAPYRVEAGAGNLPSHSPVPTCEKTWKYSPGVFSFLMYYCKRGSIWSGLQAEAKRRQNNQ